MIVSQVYTHIHIYIYQNFNFKNVQFVIYQLYLKKLFLKINIVNHKENTFLKVNSRPKCQLNFSLKKKRKSYERILNIRRCLLHK